MFSKGVGAVRKILCIGIICSIGYVSNSFAQIHFGFQNPTVYRHYRGYCGEPRTNPPHPHLGIDIVGPTGEVIDGADVRPFAPGTVTNVIPTSLGGSAGNYVEITHEGGMVTRYLHLKDLNVTPNQWVSLSDVIGHVGKTGCGDCGPHLHFVILVNGIAVDPLDFLPGNYICRSQTGCPGESRELRVDCGPFLTNPGGDHPDDTFSVADATFPAIPNIEDPYYRLAVKKGRTFVVDYYWFKTLVKERDAYFENLTEGSIPDQAYVNNLEAEISQLYESFGPSQEVVWREYDNLPDVAILENGFFENTKTIIHKSQESLRTIPSDFSPEIAKDQPVLVIPSGGLYGLENSDFLKASLDEYVKNGGTLVVFDQQHGYEFSVLPVPEEEDGTFRNVAGYGWTEDQSCFTNAAYIDTWHQIFAGQGRSTPNLYIDGYFTSYPSIATILLRRTANGQPAMILYPYGNGHVIVTSMYSDFVSGYIQAASEEMALIRDIVSWSKRPEILPEVKPGETISVTITVKNNTTLHAPSVKLTVYDPDRKKVLKEEVVNSSVPAGDSSQLTTQFSTLTTSSLGIYHIDYTLLDGQGKIVQPQTETDSGRFVVSNPPRTGYQRNDITFSLQSDTELYVVGSMVTFTINIWNNTDAERTITARYDNQSNSITIAPKAFGKITYSKVINYGLGLSVSLFDESDKNIGNLFKFCWPVYPWASMTTATEKSLYAKGETVSTDASLKNGISLGWQPNVRIVVSDSRGRKVFEETRTVFLPPKGSSSFTTSFKLLPDLIVGSYSINTTASYGNLFGASAYAGFVLPQTECTVTPDLPVAFTSGTNIIPFTITNRGIVNVSSGLLNVSLKDPDGSVIHSDSHPFSLAIGESKSLDVPVAIASLRFGNYTLTYSQSDETRTGQPTNIIIPSSVEFSCSFDKTYHRIRETFDLKVNLMNTGKFSLDNVSVTVSIPDASYSETKTISLGIDPGTAELNYAVVIPETITAGWHYGNVTLMLSGGDSIVRGIGFGVSQSSLALKYEGAASLSWGDTLNVIVENTGGVDSSYSYNIYLYDQSGIEIDTKYGSGSVLAGGQDSLSYAIPEHVLEGRYSLTVEAYDDRTHKTVYRFVPLNIVGLKATLSVKTDKEIYFSSEATTTLSTIVNQDKPIVDGNLHLEIGCANPYASPVIPRSFYISTMENNNWVERGVFHFPWYFERRELTLPITRYSSGLAVVRFEQRGIENAFIDYLVLKDDNGNLYSPYYVGVYEQDEFTSEAQAEDGWAADVTGRAFYAHWRGLPSNGFFTLVLIAKEGEGCGLIWEENRVINLDAGVTGKIDIPAGVIGQKGKFYLRGTLTNKFGQTIDFSSHPFYIIDSDTVLTFSTDKETYRPGETVTITGKLENRAQITADSLNLQITSDGEEIYAAEVNLPTGGIYPFTINTTAWSEGTVTLSGTVSQNNVDLTSIDDLYEVASPYLDIFVEAPEVIGKEPFDLGLRIMNWGIVDAHVTVKISDHKANIIDERQITVPAGEERLLQYSQQITEDTIYTVELTGDLIQTLDQTVTYGEALQIWMDKQGSINPEGKVAIHVMITNTGQLDEEIEVTYELKSQDSGPTTMVKSYYLPEGANTTETLYFELNEGDYQITANSQLPVSSAQVGFSVRKENRVEMLVSLGTQTDGLIPVNVNLNNVGFNTLDGSVWCRLYSADNKEIWNSEQSVSQLLTQNPRFLAFAINPSAFAPGDYTLKVELLNNGGQSLSLQTLPLGILGPIFQITQIPGYQVFYPGEEATFVFKVKNMGNQEGAIELSLNAYDLMNSVQREWLKPGEEKAISFGFILPEDLEEKDYFASYELKDPRGQGPEGSRGQIKYHLAGISLNVNASLDKPYYSEGEIAHLTLNVQSSNPGSLSLFARVNYPGYESEQPFTLSGNQAMFFDIPLPQIKGEKLFYGVYHESGRSVHLNSLYIHRAGDVITITTNKQVYDPGETVFVSITGSVSGDMTLSGPGGYEETFLFSGQATRSFTLPSTMAAGTYFINAQLEASNPGTVTASLPFDVTGIQVKVLECKNDRGKYAPSDLITTNFVISSNTAIPAILKTWIVNPEGKYDLVSENGTNLSSSENSILTIQSPLGTGVSGIHRLTYGIYSEDLLLVSGSEAFDVGDGVLLGLSTDKVDYPTPNEPVNVKVKLYGAASATLDFLLDGEPTASLPVSLSGFSSIQYSLSTVVPGPHTLKAILTSGGLTSTKETTFVYGSTLPDLTVYLYKDQAIEQSSLKLTIIAANQGKADAEATILNLYDGAMTAEKLLVTLNVNALAPRESQTFTFDLNCLGRAGTNTIYGLVDPNNIVKEFNESNNDSQITLTVPEISLSTTLDKDSYSIGDTITVTGLITNLSKDPSPQLALTTTVKNASDLQIFTDLKGIPSISGMETFTLNTQWLADQNLPEGVYIIYQAIEGMNAKTQKTIALKLDKDFMITCDLMAQKIETGETAQFDLTLTPLRGFTGEVSLSIQDCPQGFTALFTDNPVSLSEGKAQTTLKIIPTGPVRAGSYSIKVTATGGGKNHDVNLSLDLTDFQMTVTPAIQTIEQLSEAVYTISLAPVNNFDSTVNLKVIGVPKEMRANLSANQVSLPKDVIFALDTSKWLLPGYYEVTILAKGRVVSHEVTVTLTVHKNPGLTPGIVTAPGPLNKPLIHTFHFNGDLMSEFYAFDWRSSASITAGDVDGDGIDEVVAGASWKLHRSPAILGIFKKDGAPIAITETEYTSRFGLTVAVGDIDGDWVEDVAMGFYAYPSHKGDDEDDFGKCSEFPGNCHYVSGGLGGVRIFQLIGDRLIDTGAIIYPYEREHYRGTPNIAMGDADGDGLPELITAPGPDPCAPAKIKVFKIDTKDGVGQWKISSLMAEFIVTFEEKKAGFGANISAGDVDGDGRAEIIVGAGPDPRNPPIVKVYRGDGTFTGIQFIAYPDSHHGKIFNHEIVGKNRFGVYVAAGDMEMDGISEIITGMGPGPLNEGWVRIFRGNGTPIGNGFLAYPKNMRFGVRVSSGNIGE